MEEDKKKLEIVSGDGENLDISPVYEHLNTAKPKCNNTPKNIVIPQEKKEDNDKDDDTKKKKKEAIRNE